MRLAQLSTAQLHRVEVGAAWRHLVSNYSGTAKGPEHKVMRRCEEGSVSERGGEQLPMRNADEGQEGSLSLSPTPHRYTTVGAF